MTPTVSVLMAAYNAEDFIQEAIESILNQTYTDFEFLIIEDGSKDSTKNIIESYKLQDQRIRAFYNEINKGLIFSLNRGIDVARGKYIARMDADDISLPQRLETQVRFMELNDEIAVSSAWMKTLGKKKETLWKSPTTHDEIMVQLFCNNCVWHPVSIIRKDALDFLDLRYNPNYLKAEDYKLWIEIAKNRPLANIPQVLHRYRIHEDQKTNVTANKNKSGKGSEENLLRRKNLPGIREELLMDLLEREITLDEVEIHAKLFFEIPFTGKIELDKIRAWVEYLISVNKDRKKYLEPEFSNHLLYTFSRTKAKSFKYYCNTHRRFTPKIIWKLFFTPDKYYQNFSKEKLFYLTMNSFIFRQNKKYRSH